MGMFERLVRRTQGAQPPAPSGLRAPSAVGADRGAPIDEHLGSAVTERLAAVAPADPPVPAPVPPAAPVAVPGARGRPVPVRHVAAPPALGTSSGGFAVLDVLTTGPSPSRDRVVEVAVVLLDAGGGVVREWTTLLGSPQALHPAARHGVDPEELWGAPSFDAVAGELLALLAGRVLTAHGAAGVLAFLRAELARAGVALPLLQPLCTVDASWQHLPSLARRRLDDCCAAAGVPLAQEATALRGARGAAGLLRSFLTARTLRTDGASGRLSARAAATAWPVPAGSRTDPRPRRLPPVPLPAAPRPPLAALADALRLDDCGLPLPAAASYAELLAELIATRVAGERCTQALAAVADVAALSPGQVSATHRQVLVALGALARTGTGDAEWRELLAWAAALGVDPELVLPTEDPAASTAAPQDVVVDLRGVPAPVSSGRRVPRQAGASQPLVPGGAPA